jgi:predicted metal-binding membrane protein
MSLNQALSAARLIRPTRRRGFCPACRGWQPGTVDQPDRAESEVSPPALAAAAFLALAAIAWAWTIWQSSSAAAMDMGMGLGSLGSFAISWAVTMAAMMLPSALPLLYEFARRSEGRRRWWAATGVVAAIYLAIWVGFGLACYVVLKALPVPPADQGAVGGLALALAGLYGLTPIKTASEARCRELCSLHGPLPFSLLRGALVVGAKYGLSCIGCSAVLMGAAAIIGMASVGWMLILAGVVFVYKLAPAPSMRRTWVLSVALTAMAAVYASTAHSG